MSNYKNSEIALLIKIATITNKTATIEDIKTSLIASLTVRKPAAYKAAIAAQVANA